MEQNQMALKLRNNFKENKPAWIVGALVIVAIIAGIVISGNKDKEAVSVEDGCQPGYAFNTVTGEKCTEETANAIPEGCEPGYKFSTTSGIPCPGEKQEDVSTTKPATLSLAEALVKYAGNVFKVSDGCVVAPDKQTVAKGTRIMVHNDSTKPHVILVGSNSFNILPYHYRTVPLETAGYVSIKCDSKQVAVVTVQ